MDDGVRGAYGVTVGLARRPTHHAIPSTEHRMDLKGKRVIILGERDGIPGPAIEACIRSAGAEPVLVQTHCFV